MSSAATTTSAGAAISPRRARRSKRTMASIRLARISTGGEAATCALCCASRGVAGEMRARDAEAIHEGEDVGGHLLDGILDARVGAVAGAAVIMNDDAKVAGEGLDLGGPERAEAGEAGHEEERGALAALLVVEVAVAQGDGGHGASARGVVHAQRALDGHDVLRPLEGRGSGRPRLARPPDGLEELLEARRRHHPEHHELVF